MRQRLALVIGGLLVVTLVAVLALSGRTYRAGLVSGIGGIIDQQSALALARRDTPLRELLSAERTRQLPIRHIFIGRDTAGKELVVWVRASVERYEYLDQYISAAQARRIAARHGVTMSAEAPVLLNYLDYPNRPVFWDVAGLYIDANTGGLMTWTGDEVIVAPVDCPYNGALAEVTYDGELPIAWVTDTWAQLGWTPGLAPQADWAIVVVEGSFDGDGSTGLEARWSEGRTLVRAWVDQSQGDLNAYGREAKAAVALLERFRQPFEPAHRLSAWKVAHYPRWGCDF